MSFSPEEQKAFLPIFQSLDKENLGVVTGEASRSTFEKSGLPPHILGEIWQLADPTNLGFLNQYSFFVALRLIGHVQQGKTPEQALINVPGQLPKFSDSANLPAAAVSQRQTSAGSIQPPPPQQLQPQYTSLPPLTNADISKFSQLFAKSATNGTIKGDQAISIFTKAKLPTSTLSEIWALTDVQNKGFLNRDEFIVAMFLIQGLISGNVKALPSVIPNQMWSQLKSSNVPPTPLQQQPSFNSSVRSIPQSNTGGSRIPSSFTSASSDWIISPEKRQQFDAIFEGLDKSSSGTLNPAEVASFLTTSKLPQPVLANIWDLADIHNNGVFTKEEFAIAMFLVQKKIAGVELPHVVPESLIAPPTAVAAQSPVVQQQKPVQAPVQPPASVSKSSYNDLLDLNDAFSTPSPTVTGSDAPLASPNPVATNTTGSYQPRAFVPTSSFGQNLAKQNTVEPIAKSPVVAQTAAPSTIAAPLVKAAAQAPGQAIGAAATVAGAAGAAIGALTSSAFASRQPAVSQQPSYTGSNSSLNRIHNSSDLLTDSNPEVSGKLSQATTELANLSNQIGSLTSQTSALHEKRTRAERELAKMTGLKNDIEGKLAKLRNSYTMEVGQTQQVEALLLESTKETETLRSELSVAEAQYNETQAKLQQLQTELEESQKENASLKERLGTLNAEQNDLLKQLEETQTQAKQSKGLVAINSEQLNASELKSEGVKAEIANLLASVKELDTHHETLLSKQAELESNKSVLAQQETELSTRQQAHLESIAQFEQKNQELEQRLSEQKEYELSVQQQEERLQMLWNDLHTRQQQLQEAEEQLQRQQIEYAERVQSFSMKQIEDATRGLDIATEEEEHATTSKSVALEEPAQSKESQAEGTATSSSLGPGLIGSAVGLVAASIGATAVAAVENTSGQTSAVTDKSTEYSSAKDSTNATTVDTETDEANYQANMGQFQQFGNLDIVRPDSTTSSVVNNAPQSVRGDYEDEDQETIDAAAQADEELPASAADVLAKDYNKVEEDQKWVKESEMLDKDNEQEQEQVESPGSFEIVDGEDEDIKTAVPDTAAETVKVTEETKTTAAAAAAGGVIPGAWGAESTTTATATDEFPPIKELDIDESDSEAGEEEEEKDKSSSIPPVTAAAPVPIPSKATQPTFDDDFDDLEPAVDSKEAEANEFDEFDGLTAAKQEDEFDEDFTNAASESQDIEDTSFYNAEETQAPQLTTQQGLPQSQGPANGENQDEWEQIFAGFGNQPQNAPAPQLAHPQPQQPQLTSSSVSTRPKVATTPRSIAVQELTGMGFTEDEALAALRREKWNLEAATNYLLDNA
ncbi:hypothetical protein WICPIJ_004164 [Wickerhamomyces pijperi]|uniref:EH domain-containing and endocytosis protein 1 n=1 Tax=Wickerhamomyces pijperi TaxID=599730 RepID=A0A9P8TNJ1_WICPI|nr:hypothetical protein WICPIJ_004164 [Wickerhamomyces pijperi]